MATAAQIEANRRNSQRSTGPRTEEGKNRSRMNALDHGCRANILVLATEDFGHYQEESNAWKLSWQPRNPVEEFLVDRVVNLSWLAKRIDRAQTGRLSANPSRGRRCGRTRTRDGDRGGTAIVPGGVRAGWRSGWRSTRPRRARTRIRLAFRIIRVPKTTPSVIGPPAESVNEPAAPIEANPVREIAPNEANSDVQAPVHH